MKKYFILFLLCCSVMVAAAAEPNHLNLSLDVAQFLGSEGQSYLEIYFSLPENDPVYVRDQDGYSCDVLMSLEIFQDDTLWANKTWRITNTVADTLHTSSTRQMVDLLRYPVAPGSSYLITLYARDTRKAELDSIRLEFEAGDISGSALLLSDLQLANAITPYDSSCGETFRKRFYCIMPNPESTFGAQNQELHYYFEAYNLQQNIHARTFRVAARLLDHNGEPLPQHPPLIHERDLRQDMIREVGQFQVSDIPSGVYKIEYSITDSTNTVLASRSKVLLIQNPDLKPAAPVFAGRGNNLNFLEDFSLQQLDEEFDRLYAVTRKEDRDIYRSLREREARRDFLYQFWTNITPSEFGQVLDFRVRYMQECQYTDTYYATPGRKGWRSDRGLIYLRYGRPSDIERHALSMDTRPYEIWHYEQIETGILFVFVDRMGFNQYELIHSTKRGELYNPSWERLLSPSATDPFSM